MNFNKISKSLVLLFLTAVFFAGYLDLKKNILDPSLKNKIEKIVSDNSFSERNRAYGNYLLSKYEKINNNNIDYFINSKLR